MTAGGEDLRRRLVAVFLEELDENRAILTEGIVDLERFVDEPPPSDLLQTLFRAAHSTKGAAHSASVQPAVRAAGVLEEHLADLRDGSVAVTHEVVDALLAAVDDLARVADALRASVAPASAEAHEPAAGELRTVRVPAVKLDTLMGHLAELVALVDTTETPEEEVPGGREVRRVTTAVADAAHELRMQRFGELCEGLPRVARDIARETGKQVDAVVDGSEIELDRSIGAVVRDALLHLVRNAVDHGIEPAVVRAERGKPTVGSVRVAAALHEGALEIVVADDGAGFDTGRLRAAAHRIGVTSTDDVDLAFVPGVSTATAPGDVSGLGVGLDAVRAAIEAIGGTVALSTRAGVGTTITVLVPRVLSTTTVLLVGVEERLFAVPAAAVARVVSIDRTRLHRIGGRTVVAGEGFAVGALADALGLPVPAATAMQVPALVCRVGAEEVALTVDELRGDARVLIRPLPRRAASTRLATGAVTLASGAPAVVLDPLGCVAAALAAGGPAPVKTPAAEERKRARVLVAEDSFTTRTLERTILEAAGYEVLVAVNGTEAWDLLQRHGADVVVSDVDMPGMDGFELCRTVRSVPRFAGVPVVLVTSLAQDEHRRRGVEVGATAYLVKSAFDQRALLAAIEDLVS